MDVVVDASVLVEVIVETDSAAATWLAELVGGDDIYWVPGLTPLEAVSALRSLVRRGQIEETVTAYDAAYVALAEALQSESGGNATLATADEKLARAPGPTCPIALYGRP